MCILVGGKVEVHAVSRSGPGGLPIRVPCDRRRSAPCSAISRSRAAAQLLAEEVGQAVGLGHEGLQADAIDEAERPAGIGRIAHAEDGADVTVGRVDSSTPSSIARAASTACT
jgi:hypothetical protein